MRPVSTNNKNEVSRAVVFEAPGQLRIRDIPLPGPGPDDVLVEVDWTGISTGTEKLLWEGRMPSFPGLGYPLVPGYETVGRIVAAGSAAENRIGERVFVAGARCFGKVRGLFGGAASMLVVPASSALAIDDFYAEQSTLLALAATAHHVLLPRDGGGDRQTAELPDLIVGHGVLGRLLARLTGALGGAAPVVWETSAARSAGRFDYPVIRPADDDRHYRCIIDASGDPNILDTLVARLDRGGRIVLGGFYPERLSFDFPAAFMREIRLRIAAEWHPDDLLSVRQLIDAGRLSLDDLITHRTTADDAERAYRDAFGDPGCLKMILDWRSHSD